jgi:hypothetical protein
MNHHPAGHTNPDDDCSTTIVKDSSSSTALHNLNVEYKQLQVQEDNLHALLHRLHQEAVTLEEAIAICTGQANDTHTTAVTNNAAVADVATTHATGTAIATACHHNHGTSTTTQPTSSSFVTKSPTNHQESQALRKLQQVLLAEDSDSTSSSEGR